MHEPPDPSEPASIGDLLSVSRDDPWEVDKLYWMHAYNRKMPADVIEVLRYGPAPPPAALTTGTKQLELELGMEKHHVYAYLGRTREAFGSNVIVVPAAVGQSNAAKISPFDTGGLVKHIQPVCSWARDQRQNFLADYTWPGIDLPDLFRAYPGATVGRVHQYLDVDQPPSFDGPHEVWLGRTPAEIWKAGSASWPTWTWEARWTERIACDALVAWSCAPALYDILLRELEDTIDDDDAFDFLVSRYVRGGVSFLVKEFMGRQVPR